MKQLTKKYSHMDVLPSGVSRDEYARRYVDGVHPFDVWFSSGVVRHYSADGSFIGTEEQRIPEALDAEYPPEYVAAETVATVRRIASGRYLLTMYENRRPVFRKEYGSMKAAHIAEAIRLRNR